MSFFQICMRVKMYTDTSTVAYTYLSHVRFQPVIVICVCVCVCGICVCACVYMHIYICIPVLGLAALALLAAPRNNSAGEGLLKRVPVPRATVCM